MTDWLSRFVAESNRIEGIPQIAADEVEAHERFIALPVVMVEDLVALVNVLQPDARLRDNTRVPGVRVGSHIAPPSGPHIPEQLERLLRRQQEGATPFSVHRQYETLHPFTDGNGRSGRALWLWQMLRGSERDAAQAMQLGFLHSFYYQALEASDLRRTGQGGVKG